MIGTAAAIIGASVIGAVASNAASGKAAKASTNASNATIAAENARDAQTRADEQPFVQNGYAANNALMSRLGVSLPTQGVNSTNALNNQPGVVNASQPGATAMPAGVAMPSAKDGSAGVSPAMPDTGSGVTIGQNGSPPRSSPATAQPQQQPTGVLGVTPTPVASSDPGTYGNNTNPTYTAPGYQAPADYQAPAAFNYTAADYTASPGYQYQVDQALKGVQSSKAAQGSLYSGDTLKALSDRAQNLALQDFSNQRNFAYGQYTDNRNFGYGQYVDSRNFGRSTFDTDRAFNQGAYQDARNYLTGRYDTQTGNLFNLSNAGQSAVSATNASGQTSTNGIVNALNTNAANQGNAAIAGANATTGLLSSGVNALAYMNGAKSGTLTPGATTGATFKF